MSATAALAATGFLALAIFVLVAAPGFRWFSHGSTDSPFIFERQMLHALLLCWVICSAWGAGAGIASLIMNHGAIDRKNMALASLLVCVLLPVAATWLYFALVRQAVDAHFASR
jgi:hypothetical protein